MTTNIQLLRQRASGTEWLELPPKPTPPNGLEEAKEKATHARKEYEEFLQSVLTTPNLVVLAGSGCSLGNVGGPSMTDLWNKAQEIEGFENICAIIKHPQQDKWIESLLSRCQTALHFLSEEDRIRVSNFLTKAETMIWKECTKFIGDADLDGHKTFLRRMARRRMQSPRLKVFTTNYDLCFETAASAIGITPIDGFSFTQPRRFDPRFFLMDIVKRSKEHGRTHDFVEGVFQLLKIHGSVDWDIEKGIITQNIKPTKPCLVYPASSKYEQSYSQPHLEIMAQFQGILREPNTCLVTVGFGYNDNHLTAPILAAADSNPSFRLLVVDSSAKSKAADKNSPFSRIANRIDRGEAEIALLQAEFKQFAELIPQLRALSPADQIAKNIQRITNN